LIETDFERMEVRTSVDPAATIGRLGVDPAVVLRQE